MESLFLSLQFEQTRKPNSGSKEVNVPLKDSILFYSFIATTLQNEDKYSLKINAKTQQNALVAIARPTLAYHF